MVEKTIGQKLQALRARTGLTLREVAELAGYQGASSVQAYFSDDYDPKYLAPDIAERLTKAMQDRGRPPIEAQEILILAGIGRPGPLYRGTVNREQIFAPPSVEKVVIPPTLNGRPKDIPVYGTALVADLKFDKGGDGAQLVEQTTFDMNDIIAFVRRPPGIDTERKVYAVFVVGSSMEPRYRAGDPVFVDPYRPPAIGDDVIVQLSRPDADGNAEIAWGLIKTLSRRSASFIELEQYHPALKFRVESPQIAAVHRIIPWRECFGI